jgi:hypothetical protein
LEPKTFATSAVTEPGLPNSPTGVTSISRVTSKQPAFQVEAAVAKDAIPLTEEYASFMLVGRRRHGHREAVHHLSEQYLLTPDGGQEVNTNSAESYFALLERGHFDILHRVSKKHLHRFRNEFGFRWNHRKVTGRCNDSRGGKDAVNVSGAKFGICMIQQSINLSLTF